MNEYNKRKIEDILMEYYKNSIYEELENYILTSEFGDVSSFFDEDIDSVEFGFINSINLIEYVIKHKETCELIQGTLEIEFNLLGYGDDGISISNSMVEMEFKLYDYFNKYKLQILSII